MCLELVRPRRVVCPWWSFDDLCHVVMTDIAAFTHTRMTTCLLVQCSPPCGRPRMRASGQPRGASACRTFQVLPGRLMSREKQASTPLKKGHRPAVGASPLMCREGHGSSSGSSQGPFPPLGRSARSPTVQVLLVRTLGKTCSASPPPSITRLNCAQAVHSTTPT